MVQQHAGAYEQNTGIRAIRAAISTSLIYLLAQQPGTTKHFVMMTHVHSTFSYCWDGVSAFRIGDNYEMGRA